MNLRLVSQSLIAVGVLVASMFVGIAPASAYTTKQAAWINDAIIAKAWFNSGNSAPALGPNTFTLKIENIPGVTLAGVYWERPGVSGSGRSRTLTGPGNEITWSIGGAVNPDQQIHYKVCANFAGYSGCSTGTFDYRR
jgi:hypothetical protein